MKIWILGGGVLVAVAAAAGVSPDNVAAQQVDAEMRPLPGEYQSTVTFLELDMPGAPPQMADMMGQMMGRTFTYCLTPEEIEEGFRAMTNRSSQDGADCTYDRFSAVGGQIDAEMSCRVDGQTVNMVMEGTGSPTSSDITMTMSGDFGVGPGTMKLRAQHQRLGDC